MTRCIRHRGPDDEGYWLYSPQANHALGGAETPATVYQSPTPYQPMGRIEAHSGSFQIAMGHRRLSIQDLSPAGHQPMSSPDRRFWIVYNGEVYNFIELRKELQELGQRIGSHCDSEVLLAAYIQWGPDCLQRLNGMFAFAVFDSEKQSLFVARDRFGVKPLYMWRSPRGDIAFASEIKQFTVLSTWKARVNGQLAYDFLSTGLTGHRSDTHFEDVTQLRGGECASIDLKHPQHVLIQRWYKLPHTPFEGTFEEARTQFHDLFTDAIRIRLRADVPLGSCLSGGLDSSSIVCIINRLLKDQSKHALQQTFSACSHHKPVDESPFMKMVIDATGVEGHYTYPDLQQLFKELDRIVWHQDEPFGSTSIFAQWEVFRLAKQKGVTVMLDGQGADEQLAGYSSFLHVYLLDLIKRRRYGRVFREMRAYKQSLGMKHPEVQLLRALLPARFIGIAKRLLRDPTGQLNWLNRESMGLYSHDPCAFDAPKLGPLNEMTYAQLRSTHLPMLLQYEDRDSMAHSVESRTPFVDYRLVELVQSLPADFKIKDGETKYILREAMAGILPEGIRKRMDKIGFATPEEVWVQKEAPQLFKQEIRRAVHASQGILNEQAILLADRMIDAKAPFSFLLWRMLVFGRWMERFGAQR
jgi:asparagine synthase (glutamine-hydrolysing)